MLLSNWQATLANIKSMLVKRGMLVGLHNCSGTVKFTCICLQAQKAREVAREVVACKNSRFSLLLAAGDVLQGGNEMKNIPSHKLSKEKRLFSQPTNFLVEVFSVGIMGNQRIFSF